MKNIQQCANLLSLNEMALTMQSFFNVLYLVLTLCLLSKLISNLLHQINTYLKYFGVVQDLYYNSQLRVELQH